ncbi:hypothetical protein [uncultured Cohaesibacter sp.]|uniref:hypothetical protein n=1 Tax=uncultured Cohaesibacter sp. TaxID=1002546 RepID=UPI0029C7B345|nr:hypothetical protein [uncultured Cohaesibacter sp.]
MFVNLPESEEKAWGPVDVVIIINNIALDASLSSIAAFYAAGTGHGLESAKYRRVHIRNKPKYVNKGRGNDAEAMLKLCYRAGPEIFVFRQ